MGGGAAAASRSVAVAGDRVHGGGGGTKEGDAKEGAYSYTVLSRKSPHVAFYARGHSFRVNFG